MADIRINSLPSTATSFNTDDYIAIDGASAGTRRMLAANPPFSDVTLGTSGPSVKSSLSARAPRQGLVFDGTAGATVSVPALGTADYTFAIWINPTSLSTQERRLLGSDSAGAFEVQIDRGVAGSISIIKSNVLVVTTTGALLTAGKQQLVTITRTGTSGVISINGVQAATFTDSQNYTIASDKIGVISALQYYYKGTLIGPLVYNRALSASEVVALYEAGAPAGADYNSASNTAINTSAATNSPNTNFDYDTFTGASATGFTAGVTSSVNGSFASVNGAPYSIVTGTRYLVTFSATLTSGTAPRLSFGSTGVGTLASNVHTVTAGSNSVIFTTTATASRDLYFYNFAGESANYTISGLSVTRLGLLLAPDAAQAGGGLTWYDTSGNAANITLPASGVSWNVPSSGYWGGNLTVNGTGTSSVGGSFGIGTTTPTTINGVANAYQQVANVTGSGTCALNITGTQAILSLVDSNASANVKWSNLVNSNGVSTLSVLNDAGSQTQTGFQFFHSTGNFLFGTGSDGGQKLQVAGTALIAPSVASANIFFVRNTASNGYSTIQFDNTTGTAKGYIGYGNTGTSVFPDQFYIAGPSSIVLAPGGYTTGLTLDGSQNATFAGTIASSVARTAGATFLFANTDNTTGTSSSRLWATTGGGTGGDPILTLTVNGATDWTLGVDNSDSDKFKINNAFGLGTSDKLVLDGSGNMTIAGSLTTSAPTGGAGAWELGVYSATAPTATGYVTIEIGGVQYKLLAST